MVFSCIRYSKLEISLFTHFCLFVAVSTSVYFNQRSTQIASLNKNFFKKKYLSESRCLQELLRRPRTKVKEIGRPQPQNPGVHLVSLLRRKDFGFRSSFHLIHREAKVHLLSEVDEVVSLVDEEQLQRGPSQVVAP